MELRKQLDTVSKQLSSPCQWNLFLGHKSFSMSFTVVLWFYAITAADKKYLGKISEPDFYVDVVMILSVDQKEFHLNTP